MRKRSIYRLLVRRFMDNQATETEKMVFIYLLGKGKIIPYLNMEMKADAEQLLGKEAGTATVIPVRTRYIAAAAIIGLVTLGGLLWWPKSHKAPMAMVSGNYYKNEVLPGGNHAVLTLAGGGQIILDSTQNGNLATQGGTIVAKVDAGKLAYTAQAGGASGVYYNTIATPAGGQYQVTLADGTNVWLNALSSLRFPTLFDNANRSVELTGEAYFEVSGKRGNPFSVIANGMKVEVLGTKFNVNAYADEPSVKTSLLDGAVKLVNGREHLLLKPGEQGQTTGTGGLSLDDDADVEQAIAWKNGSFSFDDAGIQTVMRQLSRWYGIQVKYEGEPTHASFGGKMQRSLNLTQVLNGLSKSEVHFRLEGKTLTVLP